MQNDAGKKYLKKDNKKYMLKLKKIVESSELLYEYVNNYIQKNKISCSESIHQSDEINLDAPNFMENCCKIIGYWKKNIVSKKWKL